MVALSVGHYPSDAYHPLHLAPGPPGALQAPVVVDPVQATTFPLVGAVFAAGPEQKQESAPLPLLALLHQGQGCHLPEAEQEV